MYTQCPHCQTCFRIAEAHLKAAKGQVRCGSCKKVFDATNHLYDGVPSAGKHKSKPVNKPVAKPPVTRPPVSTPPSTKVAPADTTPTAPTQPPPRYNEILPGTIDIPEGDHEHIDLSTPPDRSNAPDQSDFMESMIGENSRYNNLDDMGTIDIPGAADFTESFIRFAGDTNEPPAVVQEKTPEPEPDAKPVNRYSDMDALESPATTQEQNGIDDLYSAADEQLLELNPKQLDKEIEALLDGDMAFDDDKQTSSPSQKKPNTKKPKEKSGRKSSEETRLFGLEPEQESPVFSVNPTGPQEHSSEPQLVPNDDEIIKQPRDVVSSKDIWAKTDSPAETKLPDTKQPKAKPQAKPKTNDPFDDLFLDDASQKNNAIENEIDFDDFLENNDDTKIGSLEIDIAEPDTSDSKRKKGEAKSIGTGEIEIDESEIVLETKPLPGKHDIEDNIEDDLPSLEHDIPKALRSSFETFEPTIRPIGMTMGMIVAIVILILGILGQSILFRSYQLANQLPSLAPMLTSLCNTIPCRYSGSADLSAIEVRNRDMRSHPSQKNALLVSTAVVNNASFDQPYPIIAIKLFDLSGHTVATRYFKPEEYLENLYSKFLLMESGTPVHITLAVLDPGDDAINFEISFL